MRRAEECSREALPTEIVVFQCARPRLGLHSVVRRYPEIRIQEAAWRQSGLPESRAAEVSAGLRVSATGRERKRPRCGPPWRTTSCRRPLLALPPLEPATRAAGREASGRRGAVAPIPPTQGDGSWVNPQPGVSGAEHTLAPSSVCSRSQPLFFLTEVFSPSILDDDLADHLAQSVGDQAEPFFCLRHSSPVEYTPWAYLVI